MFFNKTLQLALLLAIPFHAMATTPPNPCGNHGNNCDPDPPTTPTNPVNNEQNQGQLQGQAQGQGQGQAQSATGTGVGIGTGGAGGRGGAGGQGGTGGQASAVAGGGTALSDASATNGDQSTSVRNANDLSQNAFSGASNTTDVANSAGSSSIGGDQSLNNENAASADGSGNADVTIGGDRYEGSQTVFQAAMPSAPPVFGPGTQATVSYGQCGPYMGVSSEDVNGTYIGLFRKHQIYLGRSDRVVEYNGESFRQKKLPDGRWYLEGKRAVRTTTVLNVSGSRQVSMGGGDTGGGYGQAGVGGGSSMQRLVTQIDLEPCVAYIEQAAQQLQIIEFKEPRVPRG